MSAFQADEIQGADIKNGEDVLLIEEKGKNGSLEMVLGTALMVVSVIGSLSIYYYSGHQYHFEQDQQVTFIVRTYLVKLMPIGIAIFSVGFARHAGLLGKMLQKVRE